MAEEADEGKDEHGNEKGPEADLDAPPDSLEVAVVAEGELVVDESVGVLCGFGFLGLGGHGITPRLRVAC
jgi:hypothetical protein